MDRKQEDSFEIQSSSCMKSGIQIRLRVVNFSCDEDCNAREDVSICTEETIELVSSWLQTWIIDFVYSNCTSVQKKKSIFEKAMFFFVLSQKTTRKYPMKTLSKMAFEGQGYSMDMGRTAEDGLERQNDSRYIG